MGMFLIFQEHENRSANYNGIANITEQVGQFIKKHKTQNAGKENLGIVVDGDFPRRSMAVGSCNGKLSSGGAQTRQK